MKKVILITILISLGFFAKVSACVITMSATYYTISGNAVSVSVTESHDDCNFALQACFYLLQQTKVKIESTPYMLLNPNSTLHDLHLQNINVNANAIQLLDVAKVEVKL